MDPVSEGTPVRMVAEMYHSFWRGVGEWWDIRSHPGWDQTGALANPVSQTSWISRLIIGMKSFFFSPFMWNPEMLFSEASHAPFIDTELSTKFSRLLGGPWYAHVTYMSSSTHNRWGPCCFTHQQWMSLVWVWIQYYCVVFSWMYIYARVFFRTLVPWEWGIVVLIDSAKAYM